MVSRETYLTKTSSVGSGNQYMKGKKRSPNKSPGSVTSPRNKFTAAEEKQFREKINKILLAAMLLDHQKR